MSDSSKDAAAFLNRLDTDEAFRSRITAQAGSADTLLTAAAAEGYSFDAAGLKAVLPAVQPEERSLSDHDLEAVSGGGRFYGTAAQLIQKLFSD